MSDLDWLLDWQRSRGASDAQVSAALGMSVWTYRALRNRPRSSMGTAVVKLLRRMYDNDQLDDLLEGTHV